MGKSVNKIEEIPISGLEVSCDGGGGASGHPKVYLHADEEKGSVVCPYCSRNYVVKQPFTKRTFH